MPPCGDLQRAPRRGRREISEERAQSLCRGGLQTRKWTDNSGQERSTTEAVLQSFSGELTMPDGGSGAGGPPAMEGGYDEGVCRRPLWRRALFGCPGSGPHAAQRPRRRNPVLTRAKFADLYRRAATSGISAV
jgi:hypothetical protein